MRATFPTLTVLTTVLLLTLATAPPAEAGDPGDVTFTSVKVTPDPLIIGETLEIEATVETDSNITKVEMYYCNDDECKLPIEMTDAGGGKYTFSIYGEEEISDVHPYYLTSGQSEVWVKIAVTTDKGETKWPPTTHERYDEGYFKVQLKAASDGGDGTDGDDNEDSPGFEAAIFIGVFLAVTAVALVGRRRRR